MLALWEEGGERPASVVLNRLATDLSEHPVQLPEDDRIQLTFSAGVLRCTGHEAELGVSGVLALADKALYEAKEEGDESTFVYVH